MRKLEELKNVYKRMGLTGEEIEWLFSRIEKLEDSINHYMINVPSIMKQRNNANLHFILVERMRKAMEE